MNAALLGLVVCAATGASALSLVSVDQCASLDDDLVVPVSGGTIDFGHISASPVLCILSLSLTLPLMMNVVLTFVIGVGVAR